LRQTLARITQRLFARALAVLELALEQKLLLAQLEQIARPRDELVVIDRALEKVGGAGLQRAQAEAALLVDGEHDDRDFRQARQFEEAEDELRAVHLRHIVNGNHEVRRVVAHPVEGGLRIAERAHDDVLVDRSGELRENGLVRDLVVENDDERHANSPDRSMQVPLPTAGRLASGGSAQTKIPVARIVNIAWALRI